MLFKMLRPGFTLAPDPGDGSGGTGGQPAPTPSNSDSEDYKARFHGLQGRHQQVVEEYRQKEAGFTQQIQTLTGQLNDRTGKFEELNLNLTRLQSDHQAIVGERDTLKTSAERLKLVATEFPDLLLLEVQGLLPAGVGDELKTRLTALRETLKKQGSALAAAQLNAVTPPPPNTPPDTKTAQQLLAEANQFLREGKLDEYDKAYSAYIKALPQK